MKNMGTPASKPQSGKEEFCLTLKFTVAYNPVRSRQEQFWKNRRCPEMHPVLKATDRPQIISEPFRLRDQAI